MSRSHLAPRRIGFQQDFVVRQSLHHLQVGVVLQRAAVDADVEAHGDEFLGLGEGSVERVHHAAPSDLAFVALNDGDQIVVRVAAMKEHRQFVFVGELQLLLEIFLLHVRLAEVQAIIVEADLTDRNHLALVVLDLLVQLVEVVVGG